MLERMREPDAHEVGSFDAALEAVAANTVFTTHTRGARGPRPLRPTHDRALPESYCAAFGVDAREVARARPPARRRRLQHDRARPARLALPQRRLAHPRRRHLAHAEGPMAAGPRRREPDRLRHQRRARADLPRAGVGRGRSTASSAWAGMHRLDRPGVVGADRARSRTTSSGACASTSRRSCCTWSRHRIRAQHFRNHGSESHLDRLLRFADPDNPNVLTIGFARRFATYKRATLLFNDLDALRRLLGDRSARSLFIFAGKAHPADEPGQELIRTHRAHGAHAGVRGQDPARGGLRPAPRAAAGVGRRRVAQQSGVPAGGFRAPPA